MDFYELLRGPLAWVALIVCFGGSLIRLWLLFARAKGIHRMHPAQSFRGGVKSIVRGMVPFGLHYMRENPLFSVVTFLFHLCAVLTPVFIIAHIVLVYESWQIHWVSLPDTLADVMTLAVVTGVLFFSARRLFLKPVRHLTRASDWLLLMLIAGVFLTGFLAVHGWGPYRPMLITHLLLGEGLLIFIPFSKMIHMLLFFFTRGYLGAEYEIVVKGSYL